MSAAVPRNPPEQHDAGVRRRKTHVLVASRQQQRAHGGRHADAGRGHRAADILHGVIDRETCAHRPAGRVDVHGDLFFRVFRFEEKQLSHHQARHMVFDRPGDEHDAFLQQARIDVVGAFAPRTLLDHHGNEVHHHILRLTHSQLLKESSVRLGRPDMAMDQHCDKARAWAQTLKCTRPGPFSSRSRRNRPRP